MNLKDYQSGRRDGLIMGLRIAKEDGIQALEEEIRFRNITGINTAMSTKELGKASDQIKMMTIDAMFIIAIATLHDEFDFGEKRCSRFKDRLLDKVSCLSAGLATWTDYVEMLKEEIGFDIEIHWNN